MHDFKVQRLERLELFDVDLERAEQCFRLRKLGTVFKADPKVARGVFDFRRVVEEQLLVEVRVLVLFDKVRHDLVEVFRLALLVE